MDLLLTNGDITFDEGDVVSTNGITEIAQHVADRLQTFRKEWFLDQSFGPDYIQDVFKKNPSMTLIRSILVAQVDLSIENIAVLKNFELTLETATRNLEVAFILRTFESQEEIETKVVIG